MAKHSSKSVIDERLRAEIGTIFKEAPESVALVYPSPYAVGMSSLGFQTIYRTINETPGRAAHRAFLPDQIPHASRTQATLRTYEQKRPVGDYPVIALSVAYEAEIAGVIQVLELAGIPALAEERDERHPFILAGGPLTFSNPLPLAPFVDAIIMGEADQSVHQALDIIFNSANKNAALHTIAQQLPETFVPSIHARSMPSIGRAHDDELPAYSQITTPHTELREMFLIEPERGCHRGCTYCVMRRSTNGGMRLIDKQRVLSLIPENAKRVGLVGAATTDHPQITEIVEEIVETGREVGLSSLRADRLNDRFVAALRSAGQSVLTTALDGASEKLRVTIQRRGPEATFIRAAELAREHKMKRLKLYMMLGLPEEREEDIDELARFMTELSKIIPVALGIAPFVAKRNTPLDGKPFAGIEVVDDRLERLRKGLKGRVDVRATSARWAWVEYVLAQGAEAEGRAVLDALRKGGRFRDWKNAFDALPEDRPRRDLVIPGNRVQRQLKVV